MSLEREMDNARKNVRDAVDEAGHRTIAGAEKATRKVAGEQMTPGEKVKSVTNEAKHDIQADVDKAKQKLRNA